MKPVTIIVENEEYANLLLTFIDDGLKKNGMKVCIACKSLGDSIFDGINKSKIGQDAKETAPK